MCLDSKNCFDQKVYGWHGDLFIECFEIYGHVYQFFKQLDFNNNNKKQNHWIEINQNVVIMSEKSKQYNLLFKESRRFYYLPKDTSPASNKDLYNCLMAESNFFTLPEKNQIHIA